MKIESTDAADHDIEITQADEAEEPIEARIRRAYLNGFRDGAERASWGRWDHS